jgi:hypothetical protein
MTGREAAVGSGSREALVLVLVLVEAVLVLVLVEAEAGGSRTAALALLWLFFLFLLSCSLLLLPLAVRLFYCSSSFFPFFFLVLGKEKLMVMLSFVCWLLASLTFSSSLFLLPIPCSAAAGSCGWCCRKVKLMVMCFLLIFLC